MNYSILDLFSPMSSRDVLDVMLAQQYCHLKGSHTKFAEVFSLDQFWDCLKTAPSIRAVFPGLKQAHISFDDAPDMYASGATICVSGLEHTWSTLRALAESARNELGLTGAVEIKAYLSPEGAGFAQHYDPRTVTTVQISGSKEWRFGRIVSEQFPLGNSPFPLNDDQQQRLEQGGVETVVLRPGDLLCLPPGTIHWAAASDHSLALNCSFEYIGDTVAEIVSKLIREQLLSAAQLRQTFFRDVAQSPAVKDHNSRCIESILNEMPDALNLSVEKLRSMYVREL